MPNLVAVVQEESTAEVNTQTPADEFSGGGSGIERRWTDNLRHGSNLGVGLDSTKFGVGFVQILNSPKPRSRLHGPNPASMATAAELRHIKVYYTYQSEPTSVGIKLRNFN